MEGPSREGAYGRAAVKGCKSYYRVDRAKGEEWVSGGDFNTETQRRREVREFRV